MMRNCANWQRNWERHGCVCPVPGRLRLYYDFDGTCNGKVPEGYLNVLTKEQWIGVLDFVKAIGAKTYDFRSKLSWTS